MKTGLISASNQIIFLSKIILGTCYFGTDISEDVSYDLLDTYYAAGGRTLDTARAYGLTEGGISKSEQLVGKWIRERDVRKEMILVTKGGFPHKENMHASRLTKAEIYSDFAASLRDLETDYVDVYFLHRDDKTIPVSDLMDTLHELIQSGKIRAIGASNWTTDRIEEANRYAAQHHETPFTVSEIQWSLASSTPESWNDDTLVCMNDLEYRNYLNLGIPVMAYSPQAKGIFSKYISGGKASLSQKVIDRFLSEDTLEKIERVRELSRKTGLSPAAVALRFITGNPLEGFAIVGCSNRSQLLDSLTAVDADIDITLFQ